MCSRFDSLVNQNCYALTQRLAKPEVKRS